MYDQDYLAHLGVAHDDNPPGRGSGRYAWGSGANPNQHEPYDLYFRIKEMRKSGMSDKTIGELLFGPGTSANYVKSAYSDARAAYNKVENERCLKVLKECNYNYSEAARRLGYKRDTSLRSFLASMEKESSDRIQNTKEWLKKQVEEYNNDVNKGMIDVSKGVEFQIGVTESTKKAAIDSLVREGYVTKTVWVNQAGAGGKKKTSILVLCPPGTDPKSVYPNLANIISPGVTMVSKDLGKTFTTIQQPVSMDSSRIAVRYAEEGGKEKDGVIEIRRGLNDINLGKDTYAQVRIAVDDTHYLKGVAVYADDLPAGVDVVFNTNKTKDVPMMGPKDNTVLKPLKAEDPNNPSARFGATIKPGGQSYYTDEKGEQHLSPVNKVNSEGDWDNWSRDLSSQFLSKQGEANVRLQTNYSIDVKAAELEQIKRLTNPVVKKKLLEEYAEKCDSNASDLKVKGFRGQSFQLLMPVTTLKDDEVYAPNYKNGEQVALVRYPHQGTFEIAVCTVNNNNSEGRRVITPGGRDAVGVNQRVADRLSGADFDGDTVTVIPLDRNKQFSIKTSQPFEDMKDWDYQTIYRLADTSKTASDHTKQVEMGKTTNLLQDMSLNDEVTSADIERATKHAMVVIDCVKHNLDYKKSEKENDIADLRTRYQTWTDDEGKEHTGGASTIVTRAGKKQNRIDEVKEVTSYSYIKSIDDETAKQWGFKNKQEVIDRWNNGDRIYRKTGATVEERKEIKVKKGSTPEETYTPEELEWYNKQKAEGKTPKIYRTVGEKKKQSEIKPMYLVDDATKLVRNKGNGVEMAYAEYANNLKDLAREARRESRNMTTYSIDPSAKTAYQDEIDSLNRKLRQVEEKAPYARQADIYAETLYRAWKRDNPDADKDQKTKMQQQYARIARESYNSTKPKIEITPKEWEAIQSHAISATKVESILNNVKPEKVKELATPKEGIQLSEREKQLIKTLKARGETNADIADYLGVSASTVSRIANE